MQIKAATITTGEASLRNQTMGLARCLTCLIKEYIVKPPPLLGKLPALLVPKIFLDLPDIQDANLLIACGRRSAAYSLALKKQNPRLFTIYIQNPQIPLRYFDVVVPMQHDNCSGKNVFPIQTAIHHLRREDLNRASAPFFAQLKMLPEKKVAFILGGNTKDFRFTKANLDKILIAMDRFKQAGHGVLVSTARRTPEHITEELKRQSHRYDWGFFGEGENPYLCFLNEADSFVMTSDSVSMISETLFTGKPIYLIDLQGFNKRLNKFKTGLLEQGFVREWSDEIADYSYDAPDSKQLVAEKIKQEFIKFNMG